MKRILTVLFMMALISPAMAVVQWNKGIPAASDLKSAWPAASQANLSILDTLISNYQRGFYLTYTSSSTITATPGEIVVSNSTGTIRLFLVQTTSTAITFSNIDTGSLADSTQYYVYAGTSTNTDSAPTFYISLSSTAPTGVTYYQKIGSLFTDPSGNITQVFSSNNNSYVGNSTSKSGGVTYTALTDGIAIGQLSGIASGNAGSMSSYLSGNLINTVTFQGGGTASADTISLVIQKGQTWEITGASSVNFYPLGN